MSKRNRTSTQTTPTTTPPLPTMWGVTLDTTTQTEVPMFTENTHSTENTPVTEVVTLTENTPVTEVVTPTEVQVVPETPNYVPTFGVVYHPQIGIIGTLRTMLYQPNGCTKQEVLGVLTTLFTDRCVYGMGTTVQIQLGRLQRKHGPITSVVVPGRGRVYGFVGYLTVTGNPTTPTTPTHHTTQLPPHWV